MGKKGNPDETIPIRNPDFIIDAEWFKQAGWTIAGNTANHTSPGLGERFLIQLNLNFPENNLFIIEYTITNMNVVGGNEGLQVVIGAIAADTRHKTNGFKQDVMSIPAGAGQMAFGFFALAAGRGCSVDGVVGRIPSGEVITTLGIDYPDPKRFEYHTGVGVDNMATIASRNGKTNCLIGYND